MNIYEAETMMRRRAEETRKKADLHARHVPGPGSPRRLSLPSAVAQLFKLL